MKIKIFGYEIRSPAEYIRKFVDYVNDTIPLNITGPDNIRKNHTQFRTQIIDTIAREFAKQKFHSINLNVGKEGDEKLNYLLNVSPNSQQTAFDFKYTLAYQLHDFGNAIAVPIYKKNSQNRYEINELVIKHMGNYDFGFGYSKKKDEIYLQVRNRKTMQYEFFPYSDIIHLRLNPNDIFFGDKSANLNPISGYSNVFDSVLDDYINSLAQNGRVTGTLEVGSKNKSAFGGGTQLSEPEKEKRRKNLQTRIENSFETGLLVLDDGEKFTALTTKWNKVSKEELDQILDTMYSLYGINKKVINGTASVEENQNFVTKKIKPLNLQAEQEFTRKLITKTSYTQGYRIVNTINPLDYIPLNQMGDTLYKITHIVTRNELRSFMSLPPKPGGDELTDNLNFTTKGGDANGSGTNANV